MRARWIIDCGGRVLSSLLITADGQIVPFSEEIRHVATRYVPAAILFEPRVAEHPDFLWEDALETAERATPRTFFARARKIGIRRPWDGDLTREALQLASPLDVLSSAAALADPIAGRALPSVALAMLGGLLEPVFAFIADRGIAPSDVEPFVILAPHTGRPARVVLETLFRRLGHRHVTFVGRETAAATALLLSAPVECIVIDASDDDLRLHRIAISAMEGERRFRTIASFTVPDFGWSSWIAHIATALGMPAASAFDRTITSLLTGSPGSLQPALTYGELERALDDQWSEEQRRTVDPILREALDAIGGTGLPKILAGELFVLDAVAKVFAGDADAPAVALDAAARNLANTMLWTGDDPSRRLVVAPGGTVRINTLHGEALELLPALQLPAPGEACYAESAFRLCGDPSARSVVLHLLWGQDSRPEGNATLCARPIELSADRSDDLRLALRLRRDPSGGSVRGHVQVWANRTRLAAHARFSQTLEVRI